MPTLGVVALASSKEEIGRSWIFLFPAAGLLLSTIGYITGSTDRELVTIYRTQLEWTGKCLIFAYGHEWTITRTGFTSVEIRER
jgi:hypothetical protein